ncbi:hypothetical protein [Paractinoplanes atraurantiacus]|uniref:NACHT domain-containing protein n=1 Tax=Paractinoplanes atraurantiacus TaxID=1036182 RepID=A0A285HH32_9ACTN|nr:hypothetical protein [Actinoplanes atraurantiacus]SNY35042.1 hypothetical protein SAMN05421748_104375 [Actinoplanes atraurantiacus]
MGRATAQVVVGVVGGLVIVPLAVNVATGGKLPGPLRPYEILLWPAAALCLVLLLVLRPGERRRHLRPDDPRNAGLALARVTHYVDQRRRGLLSARIPLTLDERPEAVRRPLHLVQRIGGTEFRLDDHTGVLDVFDAMDGSMLILGAPGSGKTTLLLDLAAELATRGDRIPVVLDLADWSQPRWSWRRPDRAPDHFRGWLEAQLDDRYRIPALVARAWLDEGRFVLLFDGLDEVRDSARDRCVSEINNLAPASVVVCSREADYDRLTERLSLQGAVAIRPLAPGLFGTPLMLDIERIARGRREPGALFDAYVVEMLARRRAGETEEPERALRAVRALARASMRLDAGARVARLDAVTLGEALDEPAAQVARRRLLPIGFTIGAVICAVTMALAAGWVPGVVVAAVSVAPLVRWRPDPAWTRWRFRWSVVIVYAVAVAVTGCAVAAVLALWARHSEGSWDVATVVDILIALTGVVMLARAGHLKRWILVLLLAYGVVAAALVAWRGLAAADGRTGLVIGVLTATNVLLFSLAGTFPAGPPQRRHLPTRLAVLAIVAAPPLATATWWTAASRPVLGGFAAGLFVGLVFGAFLAGIPAPSVLAWVAMTAVGEPYPWRAGLLRFAADRSLLVATDEGHRFVHLLIRDHLAACDPAALGAAVRRRRAERESAA